MKPHQEPPAAPARPKEGRETPVPHEAPEGTPSHEPAPVDMATESAAGEEDPGASMDLAITPPSDPPPGRKP